MSGGTTAGNIITDAPATYAARTWVDVTKQDFDVAISDAQLENIVGANWFNNVDDNLIQLNAWLSGTGQAPHIRAAQATIGALSLSSAVIGSGALADANTSADDLVVGNLGATARGVTLLSTSSSSLAFTDTAGLMSGYVTYTHSSDALTLGAAGIAVVDVVAGQLVSSGGSESASLGNNSNLWINVYSVSLYARDDLTIGDHTGSPALVLDRDAAGTGDLVFQREGVAQWRLRNEADGDLSLDRFIGGVLQDSLVFINTTGIIQTPGDLSVGSSLYVTGAALSMENTDATISLGDGGGSVGINLSGESTNISFAQSGSTHYSLNCDGSLSLGRYVGGLFQDGFFMDYDTGVVSVSHTFTIGNGTGGPLLKLDKADGSTLSLSFASVGQGRFAFLLDNNEDLLLRAYNGAGATLRTATFSNSTGLWTLPNDITLTGTRTLTIGDGTGSQVIVVNKSGGGSGAVTFQDTGTDRWRIACNNVENLLIERYNASAVLQDTLTVSASDGSWSFPASIGLNGSSSRLRAGTGAPGAGLGSNGDIYFRTDGTTSTCIYFKAGGAWTALLT